MSLNKIEKTIPLWVMVVLIKSNHAMPYLIVVLGIALRKTKKNLALKPRSSLQGGGNRSHTSFDRTSRRACR
jgi:hypothetical protein